MTVAELRYVQQDVASRLLVKYKRITDPFKRMDLKRTGAFLPLVFRQIPTRQPSLKIPQSCTAAACCPSIDSSNRVMRSRATHALRTGPSTGMRMLRAGRTRRCAEH